MPTIVLAPVIHQTAMITVAVRMIIVLTLQKAPDCRTPEIRGKERVAESLIRYTILQYELKLKVTSLLMYDVDGQHTHTDVCVYGKEYKIVYALHRVVMILILRKMMVCMIAVVLYTCCQHLKSIS